jgi:hypothetical protein
MVSGRSPNSATSLRTATTRRARMDAPDGGRGVDQDPFSAVIDERVLLVRSPWTNVAAMRLRKTWVCPALRGTTRRAPARSGRNLFVSDGSRGRRL